MKIPERPKVIIRHCDAYDPQRIRQIAREGLQELGLRPCGRTLVKPNLVSTGDKLPHAFTRAEVVEGVLGALQDADTGEMTELAVGERSGITIPTSLGFRQSGIDAVLKRFPGVKRYCFEETQQKEIRLSHPGRLRDYVFIPEPVANADFFVNVPKFKAHPWTTVTFSLKSYIGIQDDRHRLIDHDQRLGEKIADLQYIIQPQFICIDAIIAGEGRMLTPIPRDMKLLIMGNSQVAFDAVCCRIIGVDPREVEHIRLAEQRGFGTTEADRIEITGDVSLAEAQKRAQGYRVGLVRVEKYFEGTAITAHAGPPAEPEHTDYCWGGCPGAVEEAIELLRVYDDRCDEKIKRMHVVFGGYQGPIHARPDEWVVFIGDCARWHGQINGQSVDIESVYRDRRTMDPYTVKHKDIYARLLAAQSLIRKGRRRGGQPILRLQGCPVSVAEQVMALSTLGEVNNPLLDPDDALPFNLSYAGWRLRTLGQRLRGIPYQKPGACQRGLAAPEL
jgi:uncharacterized protein (DUF362 family)